jgi:hypothetical protein
MRVTNLCATSAIAASLVLCACSSSGGSQALPGSPQAVTTMSHSAHLTVAGVGPFTGSCGSGYITCVTVGKGSPVTFVLCYDVGGSGCTSGSFPSLIWSEGIYSVHNNKLFRKIIGSFYPNPGNPSADTIKAKIKVRNSHGVVTYYQYVEGCISSSDCINGEVGIATQ